MNTEKIKNICMAFVILAVFAMGVYCCVDSIDKNENYNTMTFITKCNDVYGINNWTVSTIELKEEIDYNTYVYYNYNHSKEVTIHFNMMTESMSQPIVSNFDTRYTCFSKY